MSAMAPWLGLAAPAWRVPLTALAGGLLIRLAGRLRPGLARLATPTGVCCGLLASAWPGGRLRLASVLHAAGSHPGGIGLAILLAAILASDGPRPTGSRLVGALPFVLGAGCGWWLAGAPLHEAGLLRACPLGVVGALLFGLPLLAAQTGAPALLASALALSGCLWVAGVPAGWQAMALGMLAAVLAGLPAPNAAAGWAGVAAVGLMAEQAFGRLPHGIAVVDIACLLSLAALLLAPRIGARAAGAGPALAGLIASAAAVALFWMARRLLG